MGNLASRCIRAPINDRISADLMGLLSWMGRPRTLHKFLISGVVQGTVLGLFSINDMTRTFEITVSNDRVSCRARTINRNFAHAAAVIVTRAHCCLTAAGHCYIMLGTIKFVDKSVNDNSARRSDHCDIIALRSGFGVATDVPHSEDELQTEFKSFTAAHLGSNTNQHTD